jgi:threonine/homoserine/homoserine lactone efflux protein
MPDLVAFILFLVPLAYSPGPGNLFFAATGARFGVRGVVPALIGYHAATWGVTAAIGFGFLTLFTEAPALMGALQVAGAVYVLWLSMKFLRAGALSDDAEAKRATWGDGAILLLLNPKAYMIMALLYAQFLPAGEAQWANVLWIASVFTLNNLGAFLLWAWAGDQMGRAFRSERSAKVLNSGFAVLLAGVALWLLKGVAFTAS